MADTVRVMVERGKKKAVESAFDWLCWERSGPSEEYPPLLEAVFALASEPPFRLDDGYLRLREPSPL